MVDPDAGDGIAVSAGPERGDLAFDDVRVRREAKVVVAAQLKVAGAGGPALEGVPPLPEVYLPPEVIIADPITDKAKLLGAIYLRLIIRCLFIRNPEQHWRPH
jgi:hypothetical protein